MKLQHRKQLAAPLPHTYPQVGQLVSGVVQESKRFGVFIELDGGVVGMLPVTQISQQYVRSIGSVLRDGDRVKAVVLNVDTEKGRIALSTKHLEPTPGEWLGCRGLAVVLCAQVATLTGNAWQESTQQRGVSVCTPDA